MCTYYKDVFMEINALVEALDSRTSRQREILIEGISYVIKILLYINYNFKDVPTYR